jgi:ribosome-associated toxin RatA of RatAB toxin-antitoxin module
MNVIRAEPFDLGTPLMNMATRLRRFVSFSLGSLLFAGFAAGQGSDFELTPGEAERVSRGETVIRADLDASQRRGTVRAAMWVNAPPARVFQAMTRCADALQFVPHLRSCQIRSRSVDDSSRLVAHEVDFGWYAPRLSYVFRADLVTDRSISFQQVSGDFKVNQGIWEFEPDASGERTLLRYRVQIDPPGYVPNWLARSTFRRELPRMLAGLKRHCEAGQVPRAHANISPNLLSQ